MICRKEESAVICSLTQVCQSHWGSKLRRNKIVNNVPRLGSYSPKSSPNFWRLKKKLNIASFHWQITTKCQQLNNLIITKLNLKITQPINWKITKLNSFITKPFDISPKFLWFVDQYIIWFGDNLIKNLVIELLI